MRTIDVGKMNKRIPGATFIILGAYVMTHSDALSLVIIAPFVWILHKRSMDGLRQAQLLL